MGGFGLITGGLITAGPPERIRVGQEMVQASLRGLEYHQPVWGELPLAAEGGISEASFRNLSVLVEKLGLPSWVDRHENGNILVVWPATSPAGEQFYLAGALTRGTWVLAPITSVVLASLLALATRTSCTCNCRAWPVINLGRCGSGLLLALG